MNRHWPVPFNEDARLETLRRLNVLDQPRDPDLDALVRVAAYVCGTPTAVVNLIDAQRQWSAAAVGYVPVEVGRGESMCATSILSLDVSYTADASADTRWADNPFVTGEIDDVRLYASAPLIVGGDQVIGTLCAFDTAVRAMSREQVERLRDLASQVTRLLELRTVAAQLHEAATRDSLTGLPNRALFEESLALALARAARGETEPALLFLDLDGFKSVNDRYGHAAGDELLREVAQRLVACVRASDLVARLAGDELVVLGDMADLVGGADIMIGRIHRALAEPFVIAGHELTISASVGAAYPTHLDETPASLLARADAAMYSAKRRSAAVARSGDTTANRIATSGAAGRGSISLVSPARDDQVAG